MPKIEAWLDCRDLRKGCSVYTPNIFQHKDEYLNSLKSDAIERRYEMHLDKLQESINEYDLSAVSTLRDLENLPTPEVLKRAAIVSCYGARINWGKRGLLERSGHIFDHTKPFNVKFELLKANDQEVHLLGTRLAEECYVCAEDICYMYGLEHQYTHHNGNITRPHLRNFVGIMQKAHWESSPLWKSLELEYYMHVNAQTLKGMPVLDCEFMRPEDSVYTDWKLDPKVIELGEREYARQLCTYYQYHQWD